MKKNLQTLTICIKILFQNRYVDSFTRLSLLPHSFPREEVRTVLAFCKGGEMVKEVQDAGATTVGGADLIKKIQV